MNALPPARPSRGVRLSLVYSWLIGPAIVGAAVALDQPLLLIGVLPILVANQFVYRRWPRVASGDEDEQAERLFEGTRAEDDLPDRDAGLLADIGFILDHPELLERQRHPTRVALVVRLAATVATVVGFGLLLVALPDRAWLAALAAFLVLGSMGPNPRLIARALQFRFPAEATDADRERWMVVNRGVEIVGWGILLIAAGLILAG